MKRQMLVSLLTPIVMILTYAELAHAEPILEPWQMQSDMVVAGDAFGDAVVGGLIYAIGGEAPGTSYATNRVQRYNPATDSWVQVASMPTARHSLSCAVVDGYIYAIGGHVGNSRSENERYDPSTNTWQSMASKPTAVGGPGVVGFAGKIYTFGGNRYGSFQSVIEVYDPNTNTWPPDLVDHMPAVGEPWRAAALGDKIYLAGGLLGGRWDNFWAYDPVTGMWDTGLPRLNIERTFHELVVVDNYLFVIGGGNASGYLTSVEWWTPGATAWTLDESLNTARGQFGAEAVGNTIYAFGGYNNGTIWSSTESATVAEPACGFSEDFEGTALDTSLWSVFVDAHGQYHWPYVAGGLLHSQGYHTRIDSIPAFAAPETGQSVIARASIRLAGDYHKFGFAVNPNERDGPIAGYYFDTVEGPANTVRALAWFQPAFGSEINLLDVEIPVTWYEFHEFAIERTPSEVIYSIDGQEVARVADAFAGALPVGVWNDRWSLMQTDWVEVNCEPAEPDIDVSPDNYDFGDVEIGSSTTAIVTITNEGDGDLTVNSIDFQAGGSSYFTVTSAPTLPATVTPGETVDVEVTFAPLEVYYSSAVLEIASDDPDEPLFEVELGGVGVVIEVPPSEQIQQILDFFDNSTADGSLLPMDESKKAGNKANAFRNMIETAGNLIDDELYEQAYEQLLSLYKKCDGLPKPPDFVSGQAAEELAERIQSLMESIIDMTIGRVILLNDVEDIPSLWTIGHPSDVIKFTGGVADELRSLEEDDHLITIALFVGLQFDGIISSFLASEGNLDSFFDNLTQNVAPEVALGQAGLTGETLSLAGSLFQFLQTYSVAQNIANSTGDVYLVFPEYPHYEMEVEEFYYTGILFAADDLTSETLSQLNLWIDAVHYDSFDEEVINPDGYTLGKANFVFMQGYVPVPNNYYRPWPWSDWTAP